MTSLRFIHTADWHLGKPFGKFPDDLAGELVAARLAAVDRIAEAARAIEAQGVLVAGDVFDNDNITPVDLRRGLNRLGQHGNVRWYLMPGNHDAARTGGIWDRIAALQTLPPNVFILRDAQPVAFGDNAVILPAPLQSRHPAADPSRWMDSAATADGVMRIGLAHGPVQGFGSDGDGGYLVSPERAESAGLNYLALGDWHGMKAIRANVWYAGTPEPDRYLDNDAGYVLAVTLDGRAPAKVDPVRTATFTWTSLSETIHSAADLATVRQTIAQLAGNTGLQRGLVELTLSGHLSLADHARLDQWRDETAGSLRHFHVKRDGLAVHADDGDLENFAESALLRDAAQHIDAMAKTGGGRNAQVAKTALIRLFGFASEAGAQRSTREDT